MQLLRSIPVADPDRGVNRVITIGAFDGLHLGHQEIFRCTRAAATHGERVAVLSFEPTPAEYFARNEPPARLTCLREKYDGLAALGFDELICPNFRSINELDHESFVKDILVARLGAACLIVGHDFRYGAGRRGDIETLQRASQVHGFDLAIVDPVFSAGQRISSTQIRGALAAGDLAAAKRMLGRDYSMSGRVVHGLGLGREIGFPTANVNLKRRKAPVDGIFAVQVDGLGPGPLEGVASVGCRPTVGGGKTLLEVFVFDFDASIYGAYITVRFKQRLRSEEKFASIAAMQAQMRSDVAAAKAALTP